MGDQEPQEIGDGAANTVQPQPIPTTYRVAQVSNGVTNMVVLEIHSAAGVHVTFMPPEIAEAVAAQLVENARKANLGLTVVTKSRDLRGPQIVRGRG